jgi:hypothetical protein
VEVTKRIARILLLRYWAPAFAGEALQKRGKRYGG